MKESGRYKFAKYKGIINALVIILKLLPRPILQFMWNCTTHHSQLPFVALRYTILKSGVKECGDNVKIGTNVQILGWHNLEIGSNVSIHSNCYIDANGEIFIGDDVSIAHNSSLLSTNHDWADLSIPIKYNAVTFGKVKRANDVWIGCGFRILLGINTSNCSI